MLPLECVEDSHEQRRAGILTECRHLLPMPSTLRRRESGQGTEHGEPPPLSCYHHVDVFETLVECGIAINEVEPGHTLPSGKRQTAMCPSVSVPSFPTNE